ncbi:MAG: serine O-acetyltransferase EpsC [Tepidisphaerales bacterium]
MNRDDLEHRISALVGKLVESTLHQPGLQHLGHCFLPNRDTIIECVQLLQQLCFPGYFGKQGLTVENLQYRIGEIVLELIPLLHEQVKCSLQYGSSGGDPQAKPCEKDMDGQAAQIVSGFLERIPSVREMLGSDVQAAFAADPAARSTDETIFCYPGIFAIMVQRLAHELNKLGAPLMPRIMTEYAHSSTGIDIHPGAELGRSFFIDHGTGVVIGETTTIGQNVKIYQGVTLGALAPAAGQMLRGVKRHPTIEDDVIIYAGATILGGETVIGKGAVIAANVFITTSVPPHTVVGMETPKLTYRQRRQRTKDAEKPT